ncbi:hypothetical protein D9757_001492 [Collybiopsis confluens]|uniref:Uncharacterized protein n=1 Tax=Collybiopsis confluens TaxID=2823264 RepID=A0A8H5MFK8_9AGAR|nr:hypothetical protein D9757_001492 [Collybiopsis confluens]
MVGAVPSEAVMYPHMNIGERRDSSMDNGSTNFQSHVPSINGALGHNHSHIGSAFSRPHPGDYRVSPSPPVHPNQNGQPTQQQQQQQNKDNYMTFSVPNGQVKRKQMSDLGQNSSKRRREAEDAEGFDEFGGQGAKHWTDEEKSKLFKWLMGPGQDEHWNSLRATKNSCLRECAQEVFGGKKTYQALKGCYERNFNLFKQIYTFESFHRQTGALEVNPNMSETDTLREYERRLASARKGGCDVGNISARTVDQWHRNGWYDLFYKRWNGDPATTRHANSRVIQSQTNNNGRGAQDDNDDSDDHGLDFSDPLAANGGTSSAIGMSFMNPSSMHATPISPHANVHTMPPQPSPIIPSSTTSPPTSLSNNLLGTSTSLSNPSSSLLNSALNPVALHSSSLHTASPSFSTVSTLSSSHTPSSTVLSSSAISNPPSSSLTSTSTGSSSSDSTVVNLAITQNMVSSYLQLLQVQTQTGKLKLEYMRKREEREERESHQRTELEKLKLDRERAEFDHKQNSANTKQKADRAIELLSNPTVDATVKQAASEFLKRLFASD